VADGTPFEAMHRHRLVGHAAARSAGGLYDVGFVEYLQVLLEPRLMLPMMHQPSSSPALATGQT
jgi:hypothetical protein